MLADFHGTARLPPAIGLRPHGPPSAGGYLPIAGHGVIGDLGTAALVGSEGTIDWYCPLRFDAPSIFGAILDARRGGHWSICPAGGARGSTQHYLPDARVPSSGAARRRAHARREARLSGAIRYHLTA